MTGLPRFVSALPRAARAAGCLAMLALLGACASISSPDGPPAAERDGPEAQPPVGLEARPDAEPRLEPVRLGGPNKPYAVMGSRHVPLAGDPDYKERGLASWYGRKFHGRPTASGERYDMYAMTAAHKTLPIPSYARVRNLKNGREVIVRINDRGPFHSDRVIDLSYTAALKLDVLKGVTRVEVERITQEDIRTGAWRRPGEPEAAAAPQLASTTSLGDAPAPATPVPLPTGDPVGPRPPEGGSPPEPDRAPAAPQSVSPADADSGAPPGIEQDPKQPISLAASPPASALAAAGEVSQERAPSAGFWLQLGAFRQREGAEQLRRRLAGEADWLAPLLAVFGDAQWFRLQAGPYASRADARAAMQRMRTDLRLSPVLVARGA